MDLLPNDTLPIIKDFIIFKPKTKAELQNALESWCKNKGKALRKYGDISLWDTSLITDMSRLFFRKQLFNSDISNWDVSNVNNMEQMFK